MSNGHDALLPWFEVPKPTRLQSLLMRAQWERTDGVAGAYEIWTYPEPGGGRGGGVFVPLDHTKEDYEILHERAYESLRSYIDPGSLARIEAQLDLENRLDLVPLSWARGTDTTPGTIPWLDGQDLHGAVTRQLMAAAKATIEPRAQFGRANSYVAQDFLSRAILAPSGVGSYVVTALTPVHQPVFASPPSEPKLGQKDRPRVSVEAIAVVRTLDTALSAVESALAENATQDSISAIVESVQQGVSHELVTALADFVGGVESTVSLPRYAWAPGALPHEYDFKPADVHVLSDAGRILANKVEPTRATVSGIVTLMAHEPDSVEREIRIFTTSRGEVRRVRMQLPEDMYSLALDAHKSDALVRVVGDLQKIGKFWHMDFPASFTVLGAEEAEAEVDVQEEDLISMALDRRAGEVTRQDGTTPD